MTTTTSTPTDVVTAAAEAVAAVLPAAAPLTAGAAEPGTPEVTAAFAGAVVADLATPGEPRIAILVGAELVEALAGSPLGGLDLGAATQPAVDAAAATLGTSAGAARTVDLALVVGDLGAAFTVVPLVGATTGAAFLVADAAIPAPEIATGKDRLEAAPPYDALPVAPGPVMSAAAPRRGIEMLHGVDMEVTVELGRTRMTVRDLLALAPGAVLELDRAAGSAADLLVNGRLIARGEVVVVDEDFGLRVTEIVDTDAVG
jgi:flagellar motor switch protein FliN